MTNALSDQSSNDISRDEWQRRYAAHLVRRGALDYETAALAAESGAEAYEQQDRIGENAVVWCGGPVGADLTPEPVSWLWRHWI